MPRSIAVLLSLFAVLVPTGLALGQGHAHHGPTPQAAEAKSDPAPGKLEEKLSVTEHSIVLDGERIDYTATAGTYVLVDDEGKQLASVFFVAYAKKGVDPAERPVTFSFNGGPGAAAVWVHMGAFGPKKVAGDAEGMALPPPGKLVDNPHSILDLTDLVFIDPIGTGFSRPAPGVDTKQFYSYRGDVESVGSFIRLWTARNARWASPKFVAGESYGTVRAAGLAADLQESHGMFLSGVMLISPRLNWQNQVFQVGNDLPNLIFLPTYTATAWYHGKLGSDLADLDAALAEAERFVLGEYATALLLGDRLDPAARRAVAEKVARLTGLSADYVERSNLRVPIFRYVKELLRDERKTVGRLDSRFTGWDRDAAGEYVEFDPAMSGVDVGYVAMLNDYLRRELEYVSDAPYRSLSYEVNGQWDFQSNGRSGLGYLDVAEVLRVAMAQNPTLEVLFACGIYDLATPYFDCEHTVEHMALPEEMRGNVAVETYASGHMMYIRDVDHAKLKADIARLVSKAVERSEP